MSEARFGPFFPGMIPVEGWTVGQAYKRAILGAQTARVYKVQRTPERELLPMAEGFGLAVMGWSPMAAGILTGKYKKGERARHRTQGQRHACRQSSQ